MNVTTLVLIFTLLFNSLIVYLVYKSNPKRLSNRVFAYLGINIWIWGIVILFIVNAKTPLAAGLWIRASFIVGSVVTLTLLALVLSIGEKELNFLKDKGFLIMIFVTSVNFSLGFLPSFITSLVVRKIGAINLPYATYGWPFFVYFVLFLASAGYAFFTLFKKLKTKKGLARAEVQYILMGCFFGFLFVILCNFVLHIVLKTQALAQFSPLGAVIMNSFIGYGIARYKILDVSVVVQRVLSYSLVILFVFLLYNLSSGFFGWMFAKHLTAESLLAETLALLVVIFAFEPSRRKINNFVSYKIFKLEYSTENLLAGMEKVLYTVGDMKVFLEKCLRIVLESVGINSGTVYFIKTGEHKTYFPVHQSLKENDWPATNAYPENAEKFLGRKPAPLLKGEIERRIPSPENAALIKEMSEINAEMAIPLLSDGRLFGILCFGEKASGKFYTPQDEEVFERLAHYLSLKVQNFLFYEQLEKVRIYQENLLENLPIGVIGTDASGVVTVVNKEAERITGLYRVNVESRHFKETLPEELRNILAYSIEKKKDLRHLRFKMKKDGVEISLDANSSVFSDRDGSLAGVQVIFSDVTHVKELEEGIQRAERFASLGIMAAGIAHEIKNPLVSIQTFANLLPEKFDDKEFRETFAVLTIKEVERINSLVEQILVFAKPRSSVFEDVDVAEVVKTTVMLMSTQFPNKKIKVTENYCTDKIVLKGDEGKLRQAFLNLFINSVQAVGSEGVINVDAGKNESSVKVTIRDNGCGIKRDVMDKIFEPFFTTKEKGTGLGLAIVARIVDEHKGVLKVESVEGKGTTVSMELPLHNEGDSENELYSFDNGK